MKIRFVLLALAAANLPGQSPGTARNLVKTYCVGCHSDKARVGNISLEPVSASNIGANAGTWEKVLRKTRSGEMPPRNLPRPDAAATAGFITWLESELDRNSKANPNPGSPAIHRLNKAEYSNAVRDLLCLDLDHSAGLPPDDASYGFDNIGEALSVSPLLMEKYMSAARRISRLALGTIKLGPTVERFTAPRGGSSGEDLPVSVRGGLSIRRYFPLDADYTFMVRVRGNPDSKMPYPQMDLRMDGKRLKLFEIRIDSAEESQFTRNYEVRVPVTAGMHTIGAGVLGEYAKVEAGPMVRQRFAPPPEVTPLSVDSITIGGPFDVRGPGDTESRRRIFVCRPPNASAEPACAKEILTVLARRAYRRSTTAADIDPLMKLFAAGRREGGTFESGIEMALRAVLVSPNFLFRVEKNPPAAPRQVSEFELASRLSFFLWSSLPDEELLRAASQGKLRAGLESQVRRMLADEKSKALIENFAGQWLQLRNVAAWRPDPDKYPAFDDSLRAAAQKETELFFDHIVREDRSVLDFLNADYSFLNERLARHYEVPGIRGNYYRKAPVNGEERGGILTHTSILTVSSYPTRTSPVLRGKWILENVIGAPPPPPPPNVPDLAETAGKSPKDLRAALEKHRENAGCAACHSRLDPLGFALENFDAIGKFRAEEGGVAIDASGQLPGGIQVKGVADLKRVLMERRDEFVECLAEKLLTYALGRGLEHFDVPAIRQVRRDAAAQGYKFSAVALSIVNSVPFQMRRAPVSEPARVAAASTSERKSAR